MKNYLGYIVAGICSLLMMLNVQAEEVVHKNLPGWKQVMNEKTDNWLHIEYIPEEQSLENWTQMVTVQSFYKLAQVKPEVFAGELKEKYEKACGNVMAFVSFIGEERGNMVLVGKLLCFENKKTNKEEFTFFKLIRGKNALYSVQWAKRFSRGEEAVTDDEAKQWSKFLRKVKLKQ